MSEAPDGHMTLVEHLIELRSRLIRAVLAVALGMLVCWVLYEPILDALLTPYCQTLPEEARDNSAVITDENCKLIQIDPLEGFSTRIGVAAYGGIALAMPVILWQVWRFIAPGLYQRERRYAVSFVLSGAVLFALGAALAYWSLPRALQFLTDIGGPDLVAVFAPAKYLSFVVKMMIAFGIGFQFPIMLIFLQLAGIVDTQTLRRARRYAIVGIVALVAVITPSGDPFTLMVLSVPMWIFYEIAILFGVLRRRRATKSVAAAT